MNQKIETPAESRRKTPQREVLKRTLRSLLEPRTQRNAPLNPDPVKLDGTIYEFLCRRVHGKGVHYLAIYNGSSRLGIFVPYPKKEKTNPNVDPAPLPEAGE